MTQNHRRGAARPIFFWCEVAPGREPYPKQREQSGACMAPEHPLLLAFAGQIKPLAVLSVPAHFGKTGILLAPIRVVSRRQRCAWSLRLVGIPDLHQVFW